MSALDKGRVNFPCFAFLIISKYKDNESARSYRERAIFIMCSNIIITHVIGIVNRNLVVIFHEMERGCLAIIGKKYEAFNLKARCAALGITLDELRDAANKATGLKKYPSDFTRARAGRDSSDSAKQIIAAADEILSKLEEKERSNTDNA